MIVYRTKGEALQKLYLFSSQHLFVNKRMAKWVRSWWRFNKHVFQSTYLRPMSSCIIETPEGGMPELLKLMYNVTNKPKFFNKCGNSRCCRPSHWSAIVKADVSFSGSDLEEDRRSFGQGNFP